MAQNVIINGVTYSSVPEVDIPKAAGGTAKFLDTTISSDAAASASILSGKKAYVNGAMVTGNITSKSAETITPNTADQTITAGQYLSGAQTIKGDANLVASNIKSGVTIFNVAGTLALPSISQDGTTKILSIS